jgi:glucans biosynthesis protein
MWKMRYLPAALGLCFLVLTVSAPAYSQKKGFGYPDVVAKAERLAQKPFVQPENLPDFLSQLSYNQWRDIRFKPEDALWLKDKLPFQAEFFFPGWVYNRTVTIDVVQPGEVSPVRYSPDLFNFGMNKFNEKALKDLGFAGFRLHFPLNTPTYYDEFAAFLGASYFRAVGKDENYGLSARGLAIDTAMPAGEEFPYFKEFWLVRPQPKAGAMTVYGLLDSPSLTGAYKFGIRPGTATSMGVTATIFLRKKVDKLGIAPLTSMFFYGQNTNIRPADNFRPQVHDSDGLQIASSTGEWIWRPLINPGKLLVTSFQLDNPKGFGLFQRDTDFNNYQDLESNYQNRPCAWVIPGENWGQGRVELVEIPTGSEKNDNIVAYWVPKENFNPGKPISFSYSIRWGSPQIAEPPLGRVVATRTSAGRQKNSELYVVDFAGGKLDALPAQTKVEADISAGGGKVLEQHIERNKYTGGWRLAFPVMRTVTDKPLELRAFLRLKDEVLTETWSYVDPFTESGCR